ncbi:Protein translocase subunit SecD (fragment) [Candidatus Sulfopaludibacter sp. SbA4]
MRRLTKQALFILAIVLVCILGIVRQPIHLGLDLRGGSSFILRVNATQPEVVEQTRRVLERRINAFGLSETAIQRYGSRGNELLVQVPDLRDPARIRKLLERRSVLEWYAVESGPYASREEAVAQHGDVLPLGRKLEATADHAWYLLKTPPVVQGTDLRDARVSMGDLSQPVTTFSLSQDAAKRFERYTQANIGRRAAIVLDDQILSVPEIEDVIRDSGQIRGARNRQEAEDLAVSLRAGALPAGVEVLQERTVEPSLGADSIRSGMRAGAVGLGAVVATMLIYYKRAGANATLALLLNGVLLMAALAYFGAVLTLPGIAGVILTIGMAVDSNVLIFERIREELRADKGTVAAIAAGFSKAFATLVDTHVTTVVSCGFLFLFGTPAVKGFAVTLAIGLVTNLFTSVFVSRVAFDWEMCRGKPLSI